MVELNPQESRLLGVVIEKATTTPEQYPLSLNAATSGANQKSNRDPVLQLTDDEVFAALESLRGKALIVRVEALGSRVHKYRHDAAAVLKVRGGELAILAELLLRGPQTLGELRGRASRMHPLETLDAARDMLRALTERPEPLVKQLPPAPGSRAERYMQLLCPDLHLLDIAGSPNSSDAQSSSSSSPAMREDPHGEANEELESRVAALEEEMQTLKTALRRLASAIGESDPLA